MSTSPVLCVRMYVWTAQTTRDRPAPRTRRHVRCRAELYVSSRPVKRNEVKTTNTVHLSYVAMWLDYTGHWRRGLAAVEPRLHHGDGNRLLDVLPRATVVCGRTLAFDHLELEAWRAGEQTRGQQRAGVAVRY